MRDLGYCPHREDHKFLLDRVIPLHWPLLKADHDLIIASQPYRARMPVEFKVEKVIAPLSKALAPGGRLLGVHSYGRDPGLEIIQKICGRKSVCEQTDTTF